ncbi:STAS domain-containing protein [Streptosporangium sp. LJ11]|uniref:STAS domain-containing protein n=1 Tax=Streptosporangium sp. LJ11 TaxID=3436927 RepID=UPI003F799FA8
MPPEGVNTLSISADARGSAIVVRAIGELDYDYAPTFRREIVRALSLSTGNSPSELPASPALDSRSEIPAPPSLGSPSAFPTLPTAFSGVSPLLPETPFRSETPFLSEVPLTSGAPLPSDPPSPLSPEPPSPFFPGSPPPPSPGSPPPLFPDGPSPLSPDRPPPDGPPSDGVPSDGVASLSTMASLSPPPQVLASFETSPEAFETSPDTRAQAGPRLILDLAGLTFCDSTGLAELLWLLRRSQETRTRLVLAGVSRTLRHMMATTGLLAYFTMAASVEEALLDEESRAAEGH